MWEIIPCTCMQMQANITASMHESPITIIQLCAYVHVCRYVCTAGKACKKHVNEERKSNRSVVDLPELCIVEIVPLLSVTVKAEGGVVPAIVRDHGIEMILRTSHCL